MKWLSVSFAGMAMALPLSANATTPAPWVVDFSQCVGTEGNIRLSRAEKSLSRSEARVMADEIFEACSLTMPPEMTPKQRNGWLKSIRKDEARRLRYQSRHRAKGL